MATFQVDHVIPESLESRRDDLQKILASYALDGSFNLNGFENWMPACAPCNNQKGEATFEALPIFAMCLKRASAKADEAKEIEQEVRTNQQIAKAVATLESAIEKRVLGKTHMERLLPLMQYLEIHRDPEKIETPLRISPMFEVLSRDGKLITVKGPYGIGIFLENPPNRGGYRCGVCGNSAWNGNRCVACGELGDD